MQELFEDVIHHFAPLLHSRQLDKGKLLHQASEISYNLFLVQSGALRSFYYVDGKDLTAHFAFEYGVIGAADSIIKGKPSRYYIETLEPSQVFVLDYREMEAFLDQHPQLERLARKFSQHLYIDLVERFEGMVFLSARDKYMHMLQRYPGITQRVSLGHIASYLGISQETLSRARSIQ
ncbi:MAG: Crp/Fnr family transcriptional regulator [Candidatus Cyclobacteriaceae bacterium M3_2C_046]